MQNRVQLALASLPQPVQAQGVSVQKKNTAILQIVTLQFARRPIRQPVPEQLRDHQPGQRTGAPAGRRQRQGVRRRHLFHAHLDGPGEAAILRSRAQGRDQRRPASRTRTSPPARSACRRRRRIQQFQYTIDIKSRLDRARGIRRHHRQGPDRAGRPADPAAATSRASNWARRPMRRILLSTASPPPASRIYQTPEANSLEVGKEVKAKMAKLAQALPGGAALRHPLSTPPSSSRIRSTKSIGRFTRPAFWC